MSIHPAVSAHIKAAVVLLHQFPNEALALENTKESLSLRFLTFTT